MSLDLNIVFSPEGVPNPRPGSIWHPADLEFLSSKKAIKKVQKHLESLPHDLNITVLVGDFQKTRYESYEVPFYDDKINVVYCNNVTTERNWIPMTSWILLHRMAHCIITDNSLSGVYDDTLPRHQGPEYALFAGLDDIWWDAFHGPNSGMFKGDDPNSDAWSKYPHFRLSSRIGPEGIPGLNFSALNHTSGNDRFGFLANHLFTMRSAREKAVSNELDIFAEAFAQYMHQGKFTLNRWEDSGLTELGHTKNFPANPRRQTSWIGGIDQDLTQLKMSLFQINQRIGMVETEVNQKMAQLAKHLVGKQISF